MRLSFRDRSLERRRARDRGFRAPPHPCRRAGRRSSRDGRRRGRRTRRGPSAVSRTIEERRSPGAVRMRTSPSFGQLLDELGDVAVGDEQGAGERAHGHALADARSSAASTSKRARVAPRAAKRRCTSFSIAIVQDSSRSQSRTLEPVGRARRHASRGWPAPRSCDLHRLAVAVRADQARATGCGDLRRRDQPAATD